MPSTSWRRKRERHQPSADGDASPAENGHRAPAPRSNDDIHIDLDLGSTGSMAGADEYSAWAERLRQKRVDSKRQFDDPSASRSQADPAAGNWQSQNVFGDTEEPAYAQLQAQHDTVAISAALAVLGLDTGATIDDVDASYRKEAKEHHPDRFVSELDAIRLAHADRFRALSTARDLLRQAHKAGGL